MMLALATSSYLQHKFWLKAICFVAAEISIFQIYQLFFPYILWNKYHHTSIKMSSSESQGQKEVTEPLCNLILHHNLLYSEVTAIQLSQKSSVQSLKQEYYSTEEFY